MECRLPEIAAVVRPLGEAAHEVRQNCRKLIGIDVGVGTRRKTMVPQADNMGNRAQLLAHL